MTVMTEPRERCPAAQRNRFRRRRAAPRGPPRETVIWAGLAALIPGLA